MPTSPSSQRRPIYRQAISLLCCLLLTCGASAGTVAATKPSADTGRLGTARIAPLDTAKQTGRAAAKPSRTWPPKAPPAPRDPPSKPTKPPQETSPRPPKRPPIIVTPLPKPPAPAGTILPPGGPIATTPSPRRAAQAPMLPISELRRSRDREVIIAMTDDVNDADAATLVSGFRLSAEVQYRSSLLGLKIVRLRIPDGRSLASVLRAVTGRATTDRRIVYVQPNYLFESTQAGTGTVAAAIPQYATDKVRLSEAHRVALGRDVRIAVIDTGVDAAHPELAGAVLDTFDAIGEGAPTVEAHGTAIAGIVAARQQFKGIAPDARLLAVRAFAANATRKSEATTLSLIKGLDWAATNGARVVNMSFAGPKDQLLQLAVEAGERQGLIFVAAAGNGGPKAGSAYPAAFDRVIAVTAIDSDDQLYEKANRGSYVALAAPGVDILAPAPSAAFEMSSGTSLAAAHVSGIVALMLERRPALTTDEARAILLRTARDPGRTANRRGLGAGIVDAGRALSGME